ncbi:M20 family metallo-hydrolase [Saccharicrinis sp. FJH2]|uniref:M20 family metallo-hydrolase n=1 Tax=Saccharicrinis sp. FJH65 TaxID=3344659 RepID=UPI0035F330C5
MNAEKAIEILKKLISIQSFSRNEKEAADCLQKEIEDLGYIVDRQDNNLVVRAHHWNDTKPVLLFNSHIDTVKPSDKWERDPFTPQVEDGKLYGLGSNDAGASVVSLLASFMILDQKEQPYNLIYVASVEEEISGLNGIASLIEYLPQVAFAVVGEPTQMHMATAEKGLMVLDCTAMGKSGHAARNEGINAIYEAIPDIQWFKTHKFDRESEFLGEVKMTVTQIEAGRQHNVVPDKCTFVVDIRSNELYNNEELHEIIQSHVKCEVVPRSYRLNSSATPMDHPVVLKGQKMGRETYGSPTTSDQAVLPFFSVKMGPGDSARSHTADEYIVLNEIREGVNIYCELFDGLAIC